MGTNNAVSTNLKMLGLRLLEGANKLNYKVGEAI